MKIGIDCLDIKPNNTGGINTYLYGLLEGFKALNKNDVKFVIFSTSKNHHIFEYYNNISNFSVIKLTWYNRYVKFLFLIFPFILNSKYLWKVATNIYNTIFKINNEIEKNCDILYTATTVLNSYNLRIKTVLSMHDIQHVHYPEFFSKMRLRARELSFYNSAITATNIQASSNFIKTDLLNFFNFIDPVNIKVIHEGVDLKAFEIFDKKYVKQRYNLEKEFIFFPAQLWKHKNHLLVLNALKLIENKHGLRIPIVLTGGKFTAYESIINFIEINKMDYVKYLGKVPWSDIISLFNSAKLMITATLYESSSLPILEAAASGLPVIASNTPPNIEMTEYIELNLFDINSIESLSEVIFESWKCNKLEQQIINNKKNVVRYSWDLVALEYITVFKQLL